MTHSHGWRWLLAVSWDLSCTVNQNSYPRSLEHGLGFLKARSKESWTSYVATPGPKHKRSSDKDKSCREFTQCLFGSHIQRGGGGKNVKNLWTYVKTTILPSKWLDSSTPTI